MAETPPQGSLLSNFLSGGNVGRTPFGSNPKKKDDWIDPKKLPADQAADIGASVANIGLKQFDGLLGDIKEGLIGKQVLKRSGGEDKVISAAFDYVAKGVDEIGDKDLLKELDIETLGKFSAKYVPFMRAKQIEDNKKRVAEDRLPIEGFGNYQIKARSGGLFNPLQAGKGLTAQALSMHARGALDGINMGGDHPELSVFTKQELAKYAPEFLVRALEEKHQEVRDAITDPSKAPYPGYLSTYLALDRKFARLLSEHESDKKKMEELRSGALHKVAQVIQKRVFNKSFIGKAYGVVLKLYSELDRATRDPIGFAFDYFVKKPLKFLAKWFINRYLMGTTKLFGKFLGKGWGTKFPTFSGKIFSWLSKQGLWGNAVSGASKGLGKLFKKGLGRIFRQGVFKLGAFVGRTLIGGAVRMAVAGIAAAIGSLTVPILAVAGAAILSIVAIAMVVMVVLIPLYQGLNPPAAAATSDLVIIASSSKNNEVGSGENLTLTFNTTAYSSELGTITLKVDLDANLNFSDGSKSQTFPTFTLNKGGSKTVSTSVTTSPQMTTKTVATINASATSSKATGFATIYLNRVGNSIGADGKHSYPILQGYKNSWGCHSPPNYNALDIIADHKTPVVAVISGTVEARVEPMGGPVVYLYGDDGFNYYYAHLAYNGRVNGRVSTGQIIGEIAAADDPASKNNGIAHTHFSIDTRGVHNVPNTPASDFLNAVSGITNIKC